MKKAAVLLCLVLGLNVQMAEARPDPSALANNCISEVQNIAEKSYDRIDNVKTATVNHISDMLLAGQIKKANITAFQAISRIRMIQRISVITISNNCRWYARFFDWLGWPELADQVLVACEEEIDQIRSYADSAVQEIRYALNGQTGNGGDEIYE